ncbi:MAG: GNAT family N-acetyltransferase [Clostridium sp.]|uniref:GNAT family N-acetyltransferase n=1 Tax=Clostridium sp. TaxID=1506 RepID=UPI002FCC3C24
MSEILYRDLVKDDYNSIKNLICEAFGFDDFIKDKKFLDVVLTIYLQDCIIDSSFSKIAEKNNKVVGLILGNAENDRNRLRKPHNFLSLAYNGLQLVLSTKENRTVLKEFSKISKTYKEIIQGKKDSFQGCIQLFIVSKECRGFGVGKTLVSYLSNYMKSMNVASIYLYTDTRCNYGFYDSQNFSRLNEKEIYFDSVDAKLNVFLYGYNLN